MMQKYTSSFFGKFSLLFFVIVLFFLSSCGKETGDQCFDNRTDEPIDLYIDGIFEFTIDEDSEDCLFFGDGCFDWYVEGVLSGDYLEGTFCAGDGNFSSTIVIK
jgi:hypothetical protein